MHFINLKGKTKKKTLRISLWRRADVRSGGEKWDWRKTCATNKKMSVVMFAYANEEKWICIWICFRIVLLLLPYCERKFEYAALLWYVRQQVEKSWYTLLIHLSFCLISSAIRVMGKGKRASYKYLLFFPPIPMQTLPTKFIIIRSLAEYEWSESGAYVVRTFTNVI